MIYFDLDGVLRDLCGAADVDPTDYDHYINGLSFVDYITENRNLLYLAKETEYFQVAVDLCKYLPDIAILTMQPESWKGITAGWIVDHFKGNPPRVIYTDTKDKITLLNPEDILIEDYPYLSSYAQVLLVDRPYNRNIIKPHIRVWRPDQLGYHIIRRYHG